MWISLPNWSFFADIVGFKLFGEQNDGSKWRLENFKNLQLRN